MEIKSIDPRRPVAMQLAKVPAFRLGALLVDPSARTVSADDRSELLEPRVMRVLVALGTEPRHVMSRDDLIELCWDGQIVSDNAINRVISLLRRMLEHLADGAVRLETITKVGFRIVVEGEASSAADPDMSVSDEARAVGQLADSRQPNWTRRAAIGGMVLTGAGIAYLGIRRDALAGPDPRARDLVERAQFQIRSGEPGSARQAIDFYKQAVAIDPEYADAWGGLAASYIHNLDSFGYRERVAAPDLARSAANRALSLDPDQPDAQLALAIPLPHFRRWFDHEKRLRQLVRRHSDYWYGHAQLGILLFDVGRANEAAEAYRRALDLEPMLPNFWLRYGGALHSAGREQEADLAFDDALTRWPTNANIRMNRYSNYLDSGRYDEAVAFLSDFRNVPDYVPIETTKSNIRRAQDLASGTGFAEHVDIIRRDMVRADGQTLAAMASFLFFFGAVDLAFDALEVSFLGGVFDGRRLQPPAATDRRSTAMLWSKTVLKHRDNPRFIGLLTRIGLEDYWRTSRTQPDYRKR